MKDKKQMICIVKISMVIQFLWPILGIVDALGAISVSVEVLFALLTFDMVAIAAGIICFWAFLNVVKEEEENAKQQLEKALDSAKKKEEELKKLIQKEEKEIKRLHKVSRKKQRGKNKDNPDASNRRAAREPYPYKEAGENPAKFISKYECRKADVNRVLIVDDSITNLKLLASYLKKMNIEARLAKSGNEAIEAVQREKFALILMDHVMKGKNGLDTVKEIRQLNGDYYANIPIVDVLSVGMEQYQAAYNNGYYQAYLTKPIAYEMLKQVMLTCGLSFEA